MAFADSQGCRIYHRLEGSPDKPLLVLVHALGCDHGMWQPQITALQEHFRILRLDLRGHGASDAPAGDYSIAQLAQDVLATVNHIGAHKFSYCGLSLGGMIGQWLGVHHGDRLEKLILANTSPRVGDPSMFETRRTTVLAEGTPAIIAATMARFFSSPTHPHADSIRAVVLATNRIGYAGCCAAIRDMDQRQALATITMPTLVIGGDNDQSTPWAGHGEMIAATIPGARVVKIDSAHLSNLEQPEIFTRALTDFAAPENQPS